jgi:cyclic beta-1,2-glucan synthetase
MRKIPLPWPSPQAPLEEPVRAELFGIERLEQHAASLAAAQPVVEGPEAGRPLLSRVEDNASALREATQIIAEAVKEERWITPAAEWLLDNFYVVDEQLREIRDDMPAGYYKELPKLADEPFAGYPRVYGIAWAFVAHTDSRFDPEMLRRFVQAYQRVQPLTIGELWAVAITMRVVLVENLRRIADAIVRGRAARQEADELADDLLGLSGGGIRSASSALRRYASGPLGTAFAVELVQRLRDQDPAVTPALAWLNQRLAAQGSTSDAIALAEHQHQASMTVTVRNIITSMRAMTAFDWSAFFESVSLVDEIFRTDRDYSAMDFISRDRYRHAVEELARHSKHTELEVALAAMANADLARAAKPEAKAEGDERRADPGYYLLGSGRRPFERSLAFHPTLRMLVMRAFIAWATPGYLGTIAVLTALILAVPLAACHAMGVNRDGLMVLGLLAAVPASDLAIALLNRFVTSLVMPKIPPRFELRSGVPADLRTLVVVPTLLTGLADVEEQVERLEVHYLANADGDVRFAILSDWTDAPAEHAAGDDEIVAAAGDAIARLNARHGPAPDGGARFLFYHRRRVWNDRERVWMGWERKRGKIHELNLLLRGGRNTTFLSPDGVPPAVPANVRFVVTLDSDTRMPIGTVKRLVGTLAHPLNRPRFDSETGHVVEGYAVLQPRVTPPLPGRSGSLYQRLSAGPAGIDPYAAAVSDVYQDLFGEGSYTGKGIYDVDAFEKALEGRVPENTLLSHDLFESVFARACLVSDVELFETAPPHYMTAARRQHRWARGDWQLLPWILTERITPVERWKMFDNLRRTLSMPATYLTLVAGWTWPESSPMLWSAFVLTTLAVPPLLPVFAGVAPRTTGASKRSHVRAVGRDFRFSVWQTLIGLTMIAHQAWLMMDAVLRTLTRVVITRRHLLEWLPTAHATLRRPLHLWPIFRRMAGGVLLAIAAGGIVVWRHPGALPVALPFVVLWLLSPAIARWISLPGLARNVATLSADEARELRLIARRTWRFFTAFVRPDSLSLPPDNFQETPAPVVAQRTSPTNIGLYLLSAVAARDFGWMGTLELADAMEATFHAVEGLEHERGHLYNWYDTTDGHALDPKYVSSVDSGNYAGALLAFGNACREMRDRPLPFDAALSGIEDAARLLGEAARAAHRGRGTPPPERLRLDDAIDVVMRVIAQTPRTAGEWATRLAELELAARTAANCARDAGEDDPANPRAAVHVWSEALRAAVETHARDLDALIPWARLRLDEAAARIMRPLMALPSIVEMAPRCEAAIQQLVALRASMVTASVTAGGASSTHLRDVDALVSALERSAAASSTLAVRLGSLADRAHAAMHAMQFGFLFDPARKLFSIGYRAADGSLDSGRYDLLASEARLLSFIAIAKGDVPVEHWFRLGRALTPVGKDSVLLSWSGSMFEYLMPGLIMRTPVGSLLEQTCRLVVQRQISYGGERGVPWGVSESGCNARDLEMTYQYSNFGVPGLGLRRGLETDVVVAPYATALAAMIDPVEATRNFRALRAAGADGQYGYYESLDYTAVRLPPSTTVALVRMYMAHHQGMVIVSLANVLHAGTMRARFHDEPIVRASELLMQERTPRDVAVARPRVDPIAAIGDVRELVPPQARRFTSPHGATPRTHLLSNGKYAVMITAAGSGYSRWKDLAVTRWREDATRDDSGSYIFLRDVASGESWSAGYQPSGAEPESYDVSFSEDHAEFARRDGAIGTRLEVIVSSEDDAELRRVSLTNHGSRAREIEVTSYAEIVLAPQAADVAHPAFGNLFVHTERIADRDILLAARRPRAEGEEQPCLAHVVAVEGEAIGDLEWETDRAQFLGRGHGPRDASAIVAGHALSNSTGPVLDPIVSLRRRVRIRPGKTVRIAFSTLVAATRAEVVDLADKYHDVTTFERAATLAWTQAQVQLHHLGVAPDEAHMFQTLGGSILYSDRTLRAAPEVIMRQTAGAAALWPHSISGDLPIVVVEIDEADDIGIVRQLLRAHEYWRMKGLAVDLVIVNDKAPSYVQDLQTLLDTLVRTSQSASRTAGQDSLGNVYILRTDRVTAAQRDALEAVARLALSSRRGTLAAQIARAHRSDTAPAILARRPAAADVPPPMPSEKPTPAPDLEFFNGLGGFAPGGREYVTVLRPGEWTPAPWINVIANEVFGFIASESGSGSTWCTNSQENRLTAWSNDPVSDPPGEILYVRDEETGEVWGPTALPARDPTGDYVIRHGQGYTRYEHASRGIMLELLQFVPGDDPMKVSRLTITNQSANTRHLSVTAYLEWVLGDSRGKTAPFVITEMDAATGAMFARNSWSRDYGTAIAFADLGGAQTAWTGDRTEFIGRNGALDFPAALARREKLSGRAGPALDPCCALQTTLLVPAGGSATVVFLLGQSVTREQARALIMRQRAADVGAQLRAVDERWNAVLGAVQVQTPDRALDLLLNGWLLYQTLACRLWARTAFYQSSGAYGFRDQLQDVMALAVARPDLARAQILRAAARQFPEGDVQHWWHEPSGRGVRTRISDDVLWLPFVAAHCAAVSGEQSLLDAAVPYLEGPALAAGQLESYFEPRISGEHATLFEHCARALDRSLAVGSHGLPLMGSGDWNDGMNRVGAGGKGESVWLAWFLYSNLVTWTAIACARGETARAASWEAHAIAIREAAEREAWDGDWYRRAYFDDGTPLGSVVDDACRIDSIAQSWSVLSNAGDPARARRAMESLDRQLVRRADSLVLLLTPPFVTTRLEPGYIKGYLAGVRENGGQYTHAATWAVAAFATIGDGDRAGELLSMLNPVHRGGTSPSVAQYKVEPYVISGDVYSEAPHVGRGGWTWYTGAAGWMYRAAVEWVLGFRVMGERLQVNPCIPSVWRGFTIEYRFRSSRYEISVENPRNACRGVAVIELDGAAIDHAAGIPLVDDGAVHRVRVVLG